MITSPAWKDRKYAVLGLARSGRATVEALLASGADVLVWDDRAEAREPFAGRCAIGNPLEADLAGYAGVVVSPGVPLNTHPIKPHADSFGVPVIGDVELFAQARADLPPHKVVGITGTNGKSTTTALVHHILKTAGVPTTMGGNIGLPILEQEPLPEGGVYVLELSSYQIDLTYSLDCDVAVLLNITPDHLDRYDGDFAKYAASKSRLLAMQKRGQNSIARFTDARSLGTFAEGTMASILEDVLANRGVDPNEQANWPSLQGPHNLENAAAAIEACDILGLSGAQIRAGLESYRGLPHRMEPVAEVAGVAYVNDSKGTNTAASAPALAAFDNIHWILGGLAKEPGLGECEAELPHVKAVYTIGKAGPDFAALLDGRVPVERCETLDRAVSAAAAKAQAGDTVLLSPACASFDQYADFEKRGDHFRALVEGLK
ncbi:UDP-N-acetylmuramoyl-L-alanine--D-glutamate ligase [Qipengyuania flava]|uniref:UDP-N-acetylmuramoyl-L-alanine--D-glutamate ligase n=1 Tax=Qipengyuania flava TaxID=192812 RepID=UPI001C56FE04|nr:UDP-N-acetylmuramoyl-L-alanine--D-glutamate ligase [Qipengyuania flava]MBW3167649.1 UDP-N-acetylmuramoyl-L-alanine--D-glutamate ligase [Qipengyuania flava]MBY5964887.1 UDP-N-acetylmuramoyl-L-alanine--D-glutamate ligase [Qipengyuania flava]MBY6011211.1 UDP-N-acetylmuramoyl-L-alanine--D-glutamate ligase [Qipengyuania flava]MBY6025653.1 UDP-N-acetylmuramoyl-L-alanine--D-glutamate ligase [Qipengyuania flava]